MTPAEKELWQQLRNGKVGGLKFRRQHPIVGRVADFACPVVHLAIELDGAAHDLPGAQERDKERTRMIEAKGWRIIRFRNDEVLKDADGVAGEIYRIALSLGAPIRD
jgi:very-short-patch-repair endonuclease